MKNKIKLKRFRDIYIAKKLYFVVGIMAISMLLQVFTIWFSMRALSSVRALVNAEVSYSKAQKDAAYQLQKYYYDRREADYKAFRDYMKVPLGQRLARTELTKKVPNLTKAREGFITGRVHPDDINGMIKLLRRQHTISYIRNAVSAWTLSDSLLAQLLLTGDIIHNEINSSSPSQPILEKAISDAGVLNERLIKVEDRFSFTLDSGSRWLRNLIFISLFLVVITVEVACLTIIIFVGRNITKGLNEINRASKKISDGNLNERAIVYSKDEIGQSAAAINQMVEQLIHTNNELRRFAYVASHDLQEPLKTLSNYVSLFKKEYEGQLDGDAIRYMDTIYRATSRMRLLIKDILDYSHIGLNKHLQRIDCNILLKDVLADLSVTIAESDTLVEAGQLPVIYAYQELNYLFLNVISNAVKFRKPNQQLLINISVSEKSAEWLFAIKDNGIGIDKIHHERIFTIFQKLHSKKMYSGSGIGLAHCKKIIEMHGGDIWVDSAEMIGSIFYFSIPKNIQHE